MYSDADVSALYDVLNPWGPSDDFYLSFVMAATSVLDVGCGTGMILHRARGSGHTGRLCGLDPDVAALDRARRRGDIEWVEGKAEDARWKDEFQLAFMASNAFQVFVTDDELRRSLSAIRRALVDGGLFVFGTRNPLVREWEEWQAADPDDVVDHEGRALRISYDVEAVNGDVIALAEKTSTPSGELLRVDRARLRFLSLKQLHAFLPEAGFAVEHVYGDWSKGPFSETSRNIVVVARAVE